PYVGLLALRIGPAAEDWVLVKAGQSVSAVVDVAAAYDMRRGGTYTVQFRGFLQVFSGPQRRLPIAKLDAVGEVDESYRRGFTQAVAQGELQGQLVVAPMATITVEGDVAVPEPPEGEMRAEALAFYGCSNTTALLNAQSTARSRAARAYNAIPSYNSFYRTWFGATPEYVSTVRTRFYNSYYRLGLTVDYYCGSYAPYCQSNYIAYTYKTTTNRIYICPAFWNQSASGQAHTVAHESFHWNTVAGADDVTYGYTNCLNLAASRPYDALRNADNYAYATTYAP
ncbi:MAG: M35 family metallopeptidase, partial [Thermoanaerobaculum sp.]|nr:M35 family metallopeptidase [Thermoanaerobaculum sp.]